MSRQVKTALLFFVFLLLLVLLRGDALAQKLTREELRLQQIKNELFHQKRKLRITKEKERKALQRLYIIKRELKSAQKKIDTSNSKISHNKKGIVRLSGELNKYQGNLLVKKKKLKHRIREIYKSGGSNLFEVIFGAVSIADFLNRSYYFGKIVSSDVVLIGEIEGEIRKIDQAKKEFNRSNLQIANSVGVIRRQKTYIQGQKTQRQKVYQVLKNRRIEYEGKVAELEASSKEMERLIRRVVADRSRRGIVAKGTGRFIWPIKGRFVSRFGYRRHPLWGGYHFHTGIDLAAPYGRPIRASDQGEVIYSGWWDGYGKAVVIDHGRGYTTVYGHMSRIYVRAGQIVEQGQFVGLVGSTGFSTGPHLHFEVRKNGKPVNPMNFL